MLSDIEICRSTPLQPIEKIAEQLQLKKDEFTSYGRYKAKISAKLLTRHNENSPGKLVLVTAITPTPLGEGKTVTTIGLAQGLAKLQQSTMACIRQPSMGPVFGVKGGAAGGGYSQVAPMDELNLHLTGDIHAVTAAHNLASAAIDARIYHEQRRGYADFEQRTGLFALRINPQKITWKRVMDHNDRALRMVTVGINEPGKTTNGIERHEGFDITAASELMAILALAKDLHDLRQRIGKIVIGYNLDDLPVTCEDLQVAGAMAVILKDAIAPTLMQTLEGVPTLIHAGPFANIAHGNSSIIADEIALHLADYVVTEAGFGSDMGFEKACNIKTAASKKAPDCVVIAATLRGVKANSGLYDIRPGMAIPEAIVQPNNSALMAGLDNLYWHIDNVQRYGIPAVVTLNRFHDDSDEEIALLRSQVAQRYPHIQFAVSECFAKGGAGGKELAAAVISACQTPPHFKPLYTKEQSIAEKLTAVCTEGYGAKNIVYSPLARRQLEQFEKLGYQRLAVCVAKTPLSITTDATLKGAPRDFTVTIREIKLCAGAGFIYALTGNVMTMPGLPDKPSFMHLDLDENGEIIGLS